MGMLMINRYGFMLAAAIVAVLAAGCATNDTSKTAANDDEKVTVTGSRIPVKDKATGTVSAATDRKSIDDMMRRAGTAGGGGN
jgi:hypothetical protein